MFQLTWMMRGAMLIYENHRNMRAIQLSGPWNSLTESMVRREFSLLVMHSHHNRPSLEWSGVCASSFVGSPFFTISCSYGPPIIFLIARLDYNAPSLADVVL